MSKKNILDRKNNILLQSDKKIYVEPALMSACKLIEDWLTSVLELFSEETNTALRQALSSLWEEEISSDYIRRINYWLNVLLPLWYGVILEICKFVEWYINEIAQWYVNESWNIEDDLEIKIDYLKLLLSLKNKRNKSDEMYRWARGVLKEEIWVNNQNITRDRIIFVKNLYYYYIKNLLINSIEEELVKKKSENSSWKTQEWSTDNTNWSIWAPDFLTIILSDWTQFTTKLDHLPHLILPDEETMN